MSNWKKALQAAAGAGGGGPFATVGYTYISSIDPSLSTVASEPLTSLKGGDHPDSRVDVAAGDLIVILTMTSDFNTSAPISYTGYTAVYNNLINASGDGYNMNYGLHYKIADGTETQIDQPYTSSSPNSMFVAGVFSGGPSSLSYLDARVQASNAGWTTSGSVNSFQNYATSRSYSNDSYFMYLAGCSSNTDVRGSGTFDADLDGTYSTAYRSDTGDPSKITGYFGYSTLVSGSGTFSVDALTASGGNSSTNVGTNLALLVKIQKP